MIYNAPRPKSLILRVSPGIIYQAILLELTSRSGWREANARAMNRWTWPLKCRMCNHGVRHLKLNYRAADILYEVHLIVYLLLGIAINPKIYILNKWRWRQHFIWLLNRLGALEREEEMYICTVINFFLIIVPFSDVEMHFRNQTVNIIYYGYIKLEALIRDACNK